MQTLKWQAALTPRSMIDETEQPQQAPWERKVSDGLGTRHQAVHNAYKMKPETTVPT